MNGSGTAPANGTARNATIEASGVSDRAVNANDVGARMRMAPPTVPRDSQSDYLRSFGLPPASYSAPFAPSNFSPLGPNFGMPLGSYSPLTYSPSAYRMNTTPTSFVRLAEQQARPAFETLESTLQAVSSVLMVLESAYFTITNSFRAVLSIVDQFGRLKAQLKRIVQAFVLLRMFKRAILYLRARLFGIDDARMATLNGGSTRDAADDWRESGDRQLSWPVMLFLLVAVGGPFLVWKLISSMLNLSENCESWKTGESEHYVAVTDYDYTAEHNDELTVTAGDELRVAPKHLQPNVRGWLLAALAKGAEMSAGLLPANYVRIVGHVHSAADQTLRTVARSGAPPAAAAAASQTSAS